MTQATLVGRRGGTDMVEHQLATYLLPANVEKLTLTRPSGATGTGNELDNNHHRSRRPGHHRWRRGNDNIDGAGGADSLDAGAAGTR